MYDAIVVGSRCAGASTALLLARQGHRVLVVDRSSFPSDTVSTHIVWQAGASRLIDWGLADQLRASCPPLQEVTFDLGAFQLTATPPSAEHSDAYYCCRRIALDQMLVDAAIDAGAEFRAEFTVDDVVWDDHAVVGIRGHDRGRRSVTERAQIVIGADGLHSAVARHVGADQYADREAQTCCYYSYFSAVDLGHGWLCPRDGVTVGAVPTNDGLTIGIVQAKHCEASRFRADTERCFWAAMDQAPSVAEPLRAGLREDRFHGTADLPNFFRTPVGEGWALVGDAGYHKDPITAQGISDAFRDAEHIANTLAPALGGNASTASALATYQKERDTSALPMYELTGQLAALEPPPAELVSLLTALRDNPAETGRFFGLFAGTVTIADFFSPENVARILS